MSTKGIAAVLQIPEKRAAFWVSMLERFPAMNAEAALISQKSETPDESYTYEMVRLLENHRREFLNGGKP